MTKHVDCTHTLKTGQVIDKYKYMDKWIYGYMDIWIYKYIDV